MTIKKHLGKPSGIYRTETIGTFRHDSPAEDAEVLHQLIKEGNDLDGILAGMESRAREVLKAESPTSTTPPAATDRKPITRTAARLVAEIGHLRGQLADPTPDDRAVALNSIRVGRRLEQLCVRPFEALIQKKNHVIARNGRSCVVTDAEHRMLCYLRDNPKADIHDFVRGVFDKLYNVGQRDRYDQQRSRLNRKLSNAGIGLAIKLSGDTLTLSYF